MNNGSLDADEIKLWRIFWTRESDPTIVFDSHEALRAKCDALESERATPSLLAMVIDTFMRDCLVAIAGAVCTPEKGYSEDGGLMLLLSDIKQLRKQHDALAKEVAELRKDAARWKFFRGCATSCQERDVLNIAEMEPDEIDAYFDGRME